MRQRRGAFWLALLSMAWLQVSMAAHQFDHSIDFVLGDSCPVCSQLDRAGDLIVDMPASDVASPQFDAANSSQAVSVVHRATIRRYDSRGPPNL
jgi:hypothetical protein